VVAKLTYASSAWIGFFSANDRQKITAFIRRSKRTGFCSSQLDDFSSLCDAADTQLFTEILHNPCHVIQALLTPPADHNYDVRDRPHNRRLPVRMSHLTVIWLFECRLVRVIDCTDCIHFYFLSSCILSVFACLFAIAVWQCCSIKEIFDLIWFVSHNERWYPAIGARTCSYRWYGMTVT